MNINVSAILAGAIFGKRRLFYKNNKAGEVMSKRNIILIGLAGTGKSSVGMAISKQIHWRQLDTDRMIESKIKGTIAHFFETRGEAAFRDLESKVLNDILSRDHQIVTTGGGAVLRKVNREMMQANGCVIQLTASMQTLLERLKHDQSRPLLKGDLMQNIQKLHIERDQLYQFAEMSCATDQGTIQDVAAKIIKYCQSTYGFPKDQ